MKSFLPCHPPHHTTVRDRLGRVATGLEKSRRASGDPVEAPPKGGMTVFLNGAHIRCRPEYQQRHLDLVVGKIESRNMCRRFGLVAKATASPGSRMREELSDFGWKPGRLLTVISDGELALPNLIRNAMGGDGQHWRQSSARNSPPHCPAGHSKNAREGAVEGRVVNFNPTFGKNFLKIAIRDSVANVEKNSVQDHPFRIASAFEINCHRKCLVTSVSC
jgi:hypothetical protein